LLTVAVVALAGAVAVYTMTGGVRGGGSVDFPEGHAYLCRDCGALTILSDDELFAIKVEGRQSSDPQAGQVPCAACGSRNTGLAVKCPRCGEYMFRPGGGRPVCPHCKQPFPSPFDEQDK
jgi:DNA-directed RNA polymerase subunit RPC12/RpoP